MTKPKLTNRPDARPARFFDRRATRAAERGDADTFEFVVGVLPIAMMLALIGAVTIIRPAQLPVWIAARECARMASATLSESIAVDQGTRAAVNSLQNNPLAGVAIGNGNVFVDYNPNNLGDPRGETVTCRVNYTLELGTLPLVGGLFGAVPLDASVTMIIEPLKSDWTPRP